MRLIRQDHLDPSRERGVERGIEQGQRLLLCRLAARRFGADAGEQLGEILAKARDPSRLEAAALADVHDGSRLEAAADLVFDCATEAELLGKLDAKLA